MRADGTALVYKGELVLTSVLATQPWRTSARRTDSMRTKSSTATGISRRSRCSCEQTSELQLRECDVFARNDCCMSILARTAVLLLNLDCRSISRRPYRRYNFPKARPRVLKLLSGFSRSYIGSWRHGCSRCAQCVEELDSHFVCPLTRSHTPRCTPQMRCMPFFPGITTLFLAQQHIQEIEGLSGCVNLEVRSQRRASVWCRCGQHTAR